MQIPPFENAKRLCPHVHYSGDTHLSKALTHYHTSHRRYYTMSHLKKTLVGQKFYTDFNRKWYKFFDCYNSIQIWQKLFGNLATPLRLSLKQNCSQQQDRPVQLSIICGTEKKKSFLAPIHSKIPMIEMCLGNVTKWYFTKQRSQKQPASNSGKIVGRG